MAVQFNYQQFSAFPRNISGLPRWAQTLVLIAAVPGAILLMAAALLALVGIVVIALLALPAYRLLRALVGLPMGGGMPESVVMAPPTISILSPEADQPPGERRQVEARVVE